MSNVREILGKKGNVILSVSPRDTVHNAIRLMVEKNIGAVLVLEGTKVSGIFSERDFIRHSVKGNLRLEEIFIKDVMTTRILIVTPAHSTEECMSLMSAKRIRHLPVMEDDKLIGLISIGDVVNKIIEDHKFSISQLEKYVTG